MTTTTAKITVRTGEMNDLPKGPAGTTAGAPKLAAGEFAYAVDTRRLFIGNDHTETVATGDGTTTEFNFNIDLDDIDARAYDIVISDADGANPVTQNKGADYTVNNEVVTFSTAPANTKKITLYYLTEILSHSRRHEPANTGTLLDAVTDQTFTAINLNIDSNDWYEIEYRIKDTTNNHHRRGVLSIGLFSDGTSTIDDTYQTSSTALDHAFNILHNAGDFTLRYTTTHTVNVDFSWVVKDWQS